MSSNHYTRLTDVLHNQTHTISAIMACLALMATLTVLLSGGAMATANTGGHSSTLNAQNSSTPLIVTHDVVISGDKPLAPGQSDCGLTTQFYHGQKSVFRVKVINPQTGQPMDNSQLQGVTIHITSGSGTTLQASYEKQGNDTFWVAPWIIPDSVPAGQVNYTISVTGQNAQPVQFDVPESQMTVLNKSVSDIQTGSSGSSSGSGASPTPSLPWVFWLVVVVVGVVVIGLVWNAERQ